MNAASASPRQVPCPTCGKPSPWTPDNRFRPFCSERCKQIDLGAWGDERYRVPQTAPDPGQEPEAS